MRKRNFFLFILLLAGLVSYAGTPPAELSIKGSALAETNQPMKMKLVDNTYEIYVALQTGTFTFDGENLIQETSVNVDGASALYYVTVNYDGRAPSLAVREVTRVIMWAPHNQFTVGEFTYKGNQVLEIENITCNLSEWGDDRYRIRFHLNDNSYKTYGSLLDTGDLIPATNGQWGNDNHGGDYSFKAPAKYHNTNLPFKVKVVMDAQYPYYYQRLTEFPEIEVNYPDHWEKKQAPIMTPWGESLDPDDLFNEYPRPQMVRNEEEWVNLNGVWDLARREVRHIGNYDVNEEYNRKVLVPFPVESALSGIMDTDYTNRDKSYVYKRTFTVPESMDGKQVLLHFGAVDWRCIVFVNGKEVGMHEGGYDPFYFNITEALNNSEEQELVVHVYDPTEGAQPHGKQVCNPSGIWYVPSTGIWQTVWMEAVEETHINDFLIHTDIDEEVVKITVQAENADANTKVDIIVYDGEMEIGRKTAEVGQETAIPVADAKLWSPDSPFLYGLKFELKKGSEIVDEVASYFGMRKIELGKHRGKPYMFLNNEPVFHYGPLDQGFWPDGLYTAPSYDALRFDLDKTKELGFNMTRKHIKTEPARWYSHCDKIGLLVWQDMINPSGHMPADGILGNTDWMKENFFRESENIIHSLKNHPSIVVWVPYNEQWGQFAASPEHTRNGVELIRKLDKTRLINATSGWTNYELGDIMDMHPYPFPELYKNEFNERANVVGETGGFGLKIEGHMWQDYEPTYEDMKNSEELTHRLDSMNWRAFNLSLAGIAGMVYTQITDVEGEQNGFYTYDRKVFKLNEEQKEIFKSGVEKMLTKTIGFIIPTAWHSSDILWKYSTGGTNYTVPAGWNTDLNYDDSSWSVGPAGFGQLDPPRTHTLTEWNDHTIYLRKTFDLNGLSDERFNNLKLLVYYDEDFEVYINGVLATSAQGWSIDYIEFEISDEAKAAIKRDGENLIAVKCIDTSGGRYIDVALIYGEIPLNEELPEEKPKAFVEISTAEQLNDIRKNLSGFYELVNDIDLSDMNFTPIGTENQPFTGYLKGNGYSIKKLKIEHESEEGKTDNFRGLFGYALGACITDLTLISPDVKGNSNVGALVGAAKGVTVERVLVYKPVVSGLSNVGGIIGKTVNGIASRIVNSYVDNGKLETTLSHTGGLVGAASDVRIVNSYFCGSIATDENTRETWAGNAGGIIGGSENIRVSLRGVASLAEKITGVTTSQFTARGDELVETKNSFARSDMQLSNYLLNDQGLGRADHDQIMGVTEFKSQATFEAMEWDFDTIWEMQKDGFPVFKNRTVDNIVLEKADTTDNLRVYVEKDRFVFETKSDTAIWIYDVKGTLVKRFDMDGNKKVKLLAGGYVVKAVSANGVETLKIVH